ncbi:HAD-IIA family hydrolase [Thermococcus sp.]
MIFDMDGVLYRGNKLLPGAKEVIEFLQSRGVPFIFLTNNSTKTAKVYRKKLASMGIEVPEERILTSGIATRLYMEKHFRKGEIFVIGGKGLEEEMKTLGWGVIKIDECRDGKWKKIAHVVVGLDPDLTYEKLKYGTLAIRNGANFIGTNPDTTYPAEEGLYPGAGAIIAALEASTEKKPLIIGKPNKPAYEAALEKLRSIGEIKEIWMIGDRLDTDITFAKRFGMKAVLVLTGVSTLKDVEKSNIKPDLVVPTLKELRDYLEVYLDEGR